MRNFVISKINMSKKKLMYIKILYTMDYINSIILIGLPISESESICNINMLQKYINWVT